MSKKQANTFLVWIFFLALQILIFNHLSIVHKYILHVYVYVLLIEHTYKPVYNILRGFCIGFIIDLFNHTFGMHSAACVALTFATNFIVNLQTQDKFNDTVHLLDIKNLGVRSFSMIYFFLILIHQSVYLLMDNWSYPITMQLAYRILISTSATFSAVLGMSIIAFIYNKTTNYKEN